MKAIVEAVYKRDALSVVNEVYDDFKELLHFRRGPNESFQNYEARFSAQVAKLNGHGKAASLHESLLGLMLLAGSLIDDSKRFSILSSVDGRECVTLERHSDSVLSQMKYEDVAPVLRQCDRGQASAGANQCDGISISANNAVFVSNSWISRRWQTWRIFWIKAEA